MRIRILVFFSLLLFISLPALAGNFDFVEPEMVKNLAVGTTVQTRGAVIAKPGILGLQIFYINGVQIYSYYKDFPELNLGDEILVKGIISQSRGEKRIKTKTEDDIIILKHNVRIPAPIIEISDLNDDLVGYLIQVKGLVIERTGPRSFIEGKNGKEIVVYFKKYTQIDKTRIKEGDTIEITGVLSQSNNELRLLPRSDQDIKIIKSAMAETKILVDQKSEFKILASTGEIIDFKKYKFYFVMGSIILGVIFIILLMIKIRAKV